MKARLHAGALVVFLLVFALVFLIVVITSTLITFILPESYASSTRIKIERKTDAGVEGKQTTLSSYDPHVIHTQLEMVRSELILKPVIEEMDLNVKWGRKYLGGNDQLKTSETLALLRQRLDVRSVGDTSLIQIRVFSDNPKEAADIANAVTKAYANYIGSTSNGLQLQVVDSAQPGFRPVRPNKPLNIALGILFGVILGLGAGSLAAWIAHIWRRKTQRPPPIP